MKTQLEQVNWVRDATPWSPETSFIASNLLREIARLEQVVKQQEQAIRNLSKRMLE